MGLKMIYPSKLQPVAIGIEGSPDVGQDHDIAAMMNMWASSLIEALYKARNEYVDYKERLGSKRERPLVHYTEMNWMLSDRDHPGSFLWLCRLFNLCPEAIIARVKSGRKFTSYRGAARLRAVTTVSV
jgi:hypothetical protein